MSKAATREQQALMLLVARVGLEVTDQMLTTEGMVSHWAKEARRKIREDDMRYADGLCALLTDLEQKAKEVLKSGKKTIEDRRRLGLIIGLIYDYLRAEWRTK